MKPSQKVLLSGALVGASLIGGAIGATVIGSAGAQTSSTPSSSTEQPSSFPAHGSPEHEGAETAVTGDAATKAQNAAVQSVGSGTAGDVTTDFTGNGYEVTVTKSDGTQVEVHMDSSFNVQTGHDGPHGTA